MTTKIKKAKPKWLTAKNIYDELGHCCWTAEEIDRYLAGRKRVSARTVILDESLALKDRLWVTSRLMRTYNFWGNHAQHFEINIRLLKRFGWDFSKNYFYAFDQELKEKHRR